MGVSRAVAAQVAAAAAVLLVSACSTTPSAPATEEPTTAIGEPTDQPGGQPGDQPGADPASLDPAYAVGRPGKRTDPIGVADILISSKDSLSPEVVEQISRLEGVEAATTISLANVPLENKVYNLAAVDPAQYRLFTEAASADLQAQWDRVAGGELAVSPELRKRLPVDRAGYLSLGVEADDLHVGAWAPQVEQVDMVVNTLRGEQLGMVPGNALVIHTGQTAPEALRDPIEAIVGEGVSVQNLDAVARFGLDPDAFRSAVLVGDFADAVGVFNFTPIGGGRIAPDPAWVSSHIVTEVVPILGTITCNKYLMPQLKAALGEIVTRGLGDEINPGEYAGCYYPRYIAGSTTLSNHSFGLALDLNTPGNQRGTVGEMDREVVAIFKYWGFAWGGDWRYTDPMHFELSQLKAPG